MQTSILNYKNNNIIQWLQQLELLMVRHQEEQKHCEKMFQLYINGKATNEQQLKAHELHSYTKFEIARLKELISNERLNYANELLKKNNISIESEEN